MTEPLGFIDVGEGPPLLAVHGAITGGRLTFGPVMGRWATALADAGVPRRIAAVDRPGFERSPGPPAPVDEQARRLVETALLLGDGRPVDAVGSSYGGLVLLRAVQERPEAFRSVVVVESATVDLCPPDMVQPEALLRIARQGWEAAAADLDAAMCDTFDRVDPLLLAGLDFLLSSGDPGITMVRDDLAIWQAMLDRYALGHATGGTPPISVLAVSGTRSHPAFKVLGMCTAAALHGRHVVLDGAGHAAHLHPDFAPLLAEFLGDLPTTAGQP